MKPFQAKHPWWAPGANLTVIEILADSGDVFAVCVDDDGRMEVHPVGEMVAVGRSTDWPFGGEIGVDGLRPGDPGPLQTTK